MLQNVFPSICRLSGMGCLASRQISFIQLSQPKRKISFLFMLIHKVFNSVDYERLKKVGPNLACAEWLLINGAGVRFANQQSLITDYNELMALEESPESASLKIEEIYANEASITSVGFRHLKDCDHIKKITFIFCTYLTDDAIFQLSYVSKTLKYLDMRACFEVTDEGILSLAKLRNLDELILVNLIYLKRKEECERTLRKALPNTKITFQPDPPDP